VITDTFPCPCCGHKVFPEPPGSYAFCPICQWQDDISQLRFPRTRGANRVSLIEAQRNYAAFGASEERRLARVRPTQADEYLDPQWRLLDLNIDQIEEAITGTDYGPGFPSDPTLLYYWRYD